MIIDENSDTENILYAVFNTLGGETRLYDDYSEALSNSSKGLLIRRNLFGQENIEVKKVLYK